MRNLVLILLLIGVYFSSCSDDDENPFGFTGSATAIKNGENWKSGLRVAKNLPYDIGIDLIFTVLSKEGFQRESLSIFRVKTILGQQSIFLTNSQIQNDSIGTFYATLIDDGDVLGDIYEVDTTASNNYVELTSIDKNKCEISGVFSLRLKLIRDDGDGPTPPEIIEFANGQFRSRVKREWLE